jgi:hypothetical protein
MKQHNLLHRRCESRGSFPFNQLNFHTPGRQPDFGGTKLGNYVNRINENKTEETVFVVDERLSQTKEEWTGPESNWRHTVRSSFGGSRSRPDGGRDGLFSHRTSKKGHPSITSMPFSWTGPESNWRHTAFQNVQTAKIAENPQ